MADGNPEDSGSNGSRWPPILICSYFLYRTWSSVVRYSVWATGWLVRDSDPGKSKRFFFSPSKRPDRLWDSPNLQLSGYQGFFPRLKQLRREVKRSHPPSACISAWRGHENFTFYFIAIPSSFPNNRTSRHCQSFILSCCDFAVHSVHKVRTYTWFCRY